jgi:hypothetical protein
MLKSLRCVDASVQETKRGLELDPLSINNNTALAFEFFWDGAMTNAGRW